MRRLPECAAPDLKLGAFDGWGFAIHSKASWDDTLCRANTKDQAPSELASACFSIVIDRDFQSRAGVDETGHRPTGLT